MIRIFKGRAGDSIELRSGFARWQEQLAEMAGWISTTAGVSDQGVFIAVVRFDSEASAGAQPDAAWAGRGIEDGVTVDDYPGTDVLMAGEFAAAGFVQTFEGRATDIESFHAIALELAPMVEASRPEEVGDTLAWRADGRFAFTGYYTSEKEARAGESTHNPELQAGWERWMRLTEDLVYFDISDPWIWARGNEPA